MSASTHLSSGLVVGTAGHIDHGKTSLVRALTGIETDRLAEEKRRGISIDLGFAHLNLPNGKAVSFVDVPGHERFIKNMLAGAAGIEAVVLIVAADESVMPQTREHFDICRLLNIQRGIIVLTKIDMAAPEQIETSRRSVRQLCAGSFLDDAPLMAVSAITGSGLDELRNELSKLSRDLSPKDEAGPARLPVDRSFALKGFGTVVTGTLSSGALRTGDTVEVFPLSRAVRVRGLQVHGNSVQTAWAGQRTAVNLAGIDSSEIRRGFTVTHQDGLRGSKVIDVSVEWLDPTDIPIKREQFLFHIGTAEIPATVKVLGPASPGLRTFARVWCPEPVLALPDDRFVLRRPSPARTVGGGLVLDSFSSVRLNRTKTITRLELLSQADRSKRIQILVGESPNGRRLTDLVRSMGLPSDQCKALIRSNPGLVFIEDAQRAVTAPWIAQMRRKLVELLTSFHQKNPSIPGAPIALARLNLEPGLASAVFKDFEAIRVQGDLVSLAKHKTQFSSEENQSLDKMELAFRQAGLQPPAVAEVMKLAGTDTKKGRGLLELLVKDQKLVRVSNDLIFHADVVAHIRKSLAAHKGRRFSVPEFKEWTQISRKYAIPLLEYLDRQHVTRREGDARIVL